jgi:hypothetical protein
MEKMKVKFVVDVLMFLAFMLVMYSGYSWQFRRYHILSAWIFVVFVVLHLLFNINMIKAMLLNMFKSAKY